MATSKTDKAIKDARRGRAGLLKSTASKHDEWLRAQISEHPLVTDLDELIVDGSPEQLKAFAGRMAHVAGQLDARTDLVGQRRWRDHAQRFGAGGPDLVTTALRARKDLLAFLLQFPGVREHHRR
ncbi:MAG: hypothetical protein ACE37F_26120 [Nannocystaceae bacterium]|nr:hypothetical protein [bacterium]